MWRCMFNLKKSNHDLCLYRSGNATEQIYTLYLVKDINQKPFTNL